MSDNSLADAAINIGKNGGDFYCDANPLIQDKANCHENVAAGAEKVRGAIEDPGGTVIKAALEGPINDFLISMWKGAVNFFQTFISSWIHAGPVISLEKDTMDWMKVATGPMVWICAVIGILIAGGKAMWNARGDDLRLMMQNLARVMIVSTGGSAFIAWMITASDSMAGWILKMAQWDKLNVKEALLKDPAAFVASAGAMSIIFSGIMVLVVLIQWILMIIRALVLPIIVLFWPISEAMNMAAGVPRFSRASRWILAFLLFKPTVAILYAFAFTLLKSQDGIGGPVMAVAVVTISIFALPFILKIVMPLSTAIGAGGGGDELIAVGKLALAAAAAGATAGAGAGAAGGAGAGALARSLHGGQRGRLSVPVPGGCGAGLCAVFPGHQPAAARHRVVAGAAQPRVRLRAGLAVPRPRHGRKIAGRLRAGAAVHHRRAAGHDAPDRKASPTSRSQGFINLMSGRTAFPARRPSCRP